VQPAGWLRRNIEENQLKEYREDPEATADEETIERPTSGFYLLFHDAKSPAELDASQRMGVDAPVRFCALSRWGRYGRKPRKEPYSYSWTIRSVTEYKS